MDSTTTPETINEPDCDFWQDKERSEKLNKLWNDEVLVDCTFLVGPENSIPEKVTGHKVMFILESPVLEKMLTGNFMEVKNNHEIRIIDFLPTDFKNFRYLIYHNDYNKYSTFSLKETFELYRIADKYLVSSITKNCMKYWKSYVNQVTPINTLITLFEFANQLSDKSLLGIINKEICRRCCEANDIVITEKLNELTIDPFYDYILILSKMIPNIGCTLHPCPSRSKMFNKAAAVQKKLTSVLIFKAIDCYFKENDLIEMVEVHETMKVEENSDEDLKKILAFRNKILRLVEFKKMTPTEFLDGPGKSGLLGWQQKYEMISLLTRKYVNSNNNGFNSYNNSYQNNYNGAIIIDNNDEKEWDKFFPQIE